MKNIEDITVQITVQEYGPELYKINETGSFIRKELCTVIKTVKHVQEFERPITIVFTEISSLARVNRTIKSLNEFIDYQEQQIKDLQAQLNTYEIENSMTIKYVQPEPQRKSLGMYEGVEIFEDTKSWFVVKDKLTIIEHRLSKSSNSLGAFKEGVYYSKSYLIPKEANARLKLEVTDKAIDYPFTITVNQYRKNDNKFTIDYAIEAFEKDHNIIYLPE